MLMVMCLVGRGAGQDVIAEFISPNLYVSPDGDDGNPGTASRPFATLDRARRAVREFKRGVPKPIRVLVRGGIYYLSAPVVFGPEDSGTDLQPITYAAYPGEKPTLSGGARLALTWQRHDGGIMKCSVPAQMRFNQLFINGKRQMRARFPNFDPDKPLVGEGGYLNTTDAGDREFTYDPASFTNKRWAHPTDAIVHIFPGSYWNNFQFRVASIDRDRHQVKLGEGGWQTALLENPDDFFGTALSKGSHFFIDNVFEELDAPGEWFLDERTSTLYYYPPAGTDLAGAKAEVGLLKRLIELKGSRQNPVRHVNFEGFRFVHTSATFMDAYISPSNGDWGIHQGGALYMEGVEDCAVESCFFDAVGGNALYVSHHARRVRVYGNTFSYTGDSAVCLVGKSHLIEKGKMPCPYCQAASYWSFGPDPEDFPAYCQVTNNVMHHIGTYGKQTAGVFMAIALKNTVDHNHIHHMPRAAICINDPFFGGHLIEYNEINDTVQETNDHGTINSWGRGRFWCVGHYGAARDSFHDPGDVKQDAKFTDIIRFNRIREQVSEKHKFAYGSTNMGIDMDDGSANFHVYNNLVIGAGVQNRDGSHRIIENNIFINPNRGMGYHVGYTHSGDQFARNIVVREEGSYPIFWILLQTDDAPWIDQLDYNLYHSSAPFSSAAQNLSQWRQLGFGVHSMIADPLFVDPENGDYRVRPESPALKLGFKNFDLTGVGLLPDFPDKWPRR